MKKNSINIFLRNIRNFQSNYFPVNFAFFNIWIKQESLSAIGPKFKYEDRLNWAILNSTKKWNHWPKNQIILYNSKPWFDRFLVQRKVYKSIVEVLISESRQFVSENWWPIFFQQISYLIKPTRISTSLWYHVRKYLELLLMILYYRIWKIRTRYSETWKQGRNFLKKTT